jgi:hypothetical protein
VLPKPQSGEADTELCALVTAWAEKTGNDAVELSFIKAELTDRLESYRKQAQWWRAAQISTWLLIAILGVLISVLAGVKTGQGVTIVAGALVATLTTLTNAIHPGKKADGYLDARLELRDECWNLLNHDGKYAAQDDHARYMYFVEQVRKIVKAKRAITNLDGLSG